MFRQILKLRQARRAFDDGNIEEALGLAEDPEIRDHLKARALRDRCLNALKKRIEERAGRGELTRAALDAERLAERRGADATTDLREELAEKKKVKDAQGERARARYFKARLEIDRGDLDAALTTLTGIEPADRDSETLQLMRDLEQNRQEAERLVKEGTRRLAKELATAEEMLTRAAALHPKAPGLRDGWLALAAKRSDIAAKGGLSDGALSSFLLEHGLFKRRHLNSLGEVETSELDRALNQLVGKRVNERLQNGKLAGAIQLLERRRENLAADASLEALEKAAKGLLSVDVAIEQGRFEDAEKALSKAEERLGRLSFSKAQKSRLKDIRARCEPALEEARAALQEGDALAAKRRIFDVLERLEGHLEGQEILQSANELLRRQKSGLEEMQNLLDRGRLEDAEERHSALKREFGAREELALMGRELRVLQKVAAKRAQSRKLGRSGTARPLHRPRSRPHPNSKRWMLNVEECGEFLLIGDDAVTIGNEAAGAADLRILANIASRHVEIRRNTSFHGGSKYTLTALSDADVLVNGESVESRDLEDGDQIQLGPELQMVFQLPCDRSKAATIRLKGNYQIHGARCLVLLPAIGRGGAVLVGNRADAHVPTPGAEGELEIYRERGREGTLTAQSPNGVSLEGAEARSKAELGDDCRLEAGEVKLSVFRR